MARYKVIDVSDWQGKIDWKKVKDDGVVGAIIRYADGTTLDKRFSENMNNAKAAGLHVGSYIFSRAKTTVQAAAEAVRLYNACKPYDPDMPLYIDLEASGLEKTADTVAAAFLNKMKAEGGLGGVYANLNWWNNYLSKTAKNYNASPFWIAQYNKTMDYKPASAMGMWQYSSAGKVNGISGRVDMDECYIAYWENAPHTNSGEKAQAASPNDQTGKLICDGIGGAATVKEMQKFFGTPQDGVISGQNKAQKKYYPALVAVEYGRGGSPCIKKLQKWVGTAQDGVWGVQTSKALQKKLNVTADGIFGANSMKALQKYLNENDKAVYPIVVKSTVDKILEACAVQAAWMKASKYEYEKNPTVAKSKKKGTCVTYESCVLQRVGLIPSGQSLWHDENGKVYGANSNFSIIYPKNKTLSQLKNELRAGDIVMDGSGVGSGSHVFILTGKWDGSKPVIWDNWSGQKGKGAYTYDRDRHVIAIVRPK